MVVYKPHGVGWLSCLSLYIGNAKARSWDKQGSFSHVFFMSITEVFTINAEAGGVVGGLWYGIV